jgi:hypothetical protein
MKWGLSASTLLGTSKDFEYRLMVRDEVEAATAGEAIAIALREFEERVKRPILGLWDLGISRTEKD